MRSELPNGLSRLNKPLHHLQETFKKATPTSSQVTPHSAVAGGRSVGTRNAARSHTGDSRCSSLL
jgi:hypothetical protein